MKRMLPCATALCAVLLLLQNSARAQSVTNFNVEYADDSNTVGLWHFNGNSANSAALSAGIPALTLQGPTLVAAAGGRFGGALVVNGGSPIPDQGGGAYIFDEDYPQLDATITCDPRSGPCTNHSFTIEFWVKPTAADLDPARPITDLLAHYKRFNTPDVLDSGRGFNVRILNNVSGESPGLVYVRYGDPAEVTSASTGTSITARGLGQLCGFDAPILDEIALAPDEWQHIAVTRNDTTWRMYIGGVKIAEVQSPKLPGNSSQPLILGAGQGFSGAPYIGMIDELRLSKVARDPSAAGYLEAPFADDANTVGLWHFDGDGLNAAALASPNADFLLKPNGNFASTDGKFGGALNLLGGAEGSSAAFIGDKDIPELDAMVSQGQVIEQAIGVALFPAKTLSIAPDLTIEAWVKPAADDINTVAAAGILAKYAPTVTAREFELRIDSNPIDTAGRRTSTRGLPFVRFGDALIQTVLNAGLSGVFGVGLLSGDPPSAGFPETAFTVDAWSHVAITRQSNLFRMWINGQVVAQVQGFFSIPNGTQPLIFGRMGGTSSGFNPMQGMIDEVRISKVARNPGAPGYLNAAYTDDANTIALWHFDGNGSNAHVGASANANVTAQNGASFQGSGGKFGGGFQVSGGNGVITDANIPELDANIAGGTTQESGPSLQPGVWTHVGITRQSGTYRMYVNGAVVAEMSCGITPANGAQPLYFGARENATFPMLGQIDEVRISKVARDLSVVPAAPYTTDANTVALWHFDGNGGNAGSGASATAVVSAQNGASFAAAGGRFGGALNVSGGQGIINDADIPELDTALAAGDFTIECFVKPAAEDVVGPDSPGILTQYLAGTRAEETFELRIDNNAAGTSGRPSALKGVPYFRSGEGVNIDNQCAKEVIGVQAPSFTIEMWVKPVQEDLQPDGTGGSLGRTLFNHYAIQDPDQGERSLAISINNYPIGVDGRVTATRGLVHFRSGDSLQFNQGASDRVALISANPPILVRCTNVPLQADTWSHVAVTRLYVDPGNDTWRMWINDQLVSQVVADAPLPDSFEPFVVGAGEDATDINQSPGTDWMNPLFGSMDELRISKIARVFGSIPCTPLVPVDFDCDGDVDVDDFAVFLACATGPAVLYNPQALPSGCTVFPAQGVIPADVDADGDVDHDDFGGFQRCYTAANVPLNPACLN